MTTPAVRALPLAIALVACRGGDVTPAIHELTGEAMGKSWLVQWHGEPAPEEDIEDLVVHVLDEVDGALSSSRPDSDLSRARAADGPIVVREETVDVVDAALAIARATDGAFDPTVQPLMELWGFRGPRPEQIPTDAEIAVTRARVDWRRVRTGRDFEGHPTLDDGGTALDVGAVAKGYAADRVSWALSDLGVFDHVVDVGGEYRVQGRSPSGSWWHLGVDLPQPDAIPGQDLAEVVALTNGALSSSGNYREKFVIGGVEVHHTMDPRTGRPSTSRILSATVLAPDCRTADGWATALLVLDPDEGMALVEARPELEALLLLPEGDGYSRRMSSGMARHLVTAPRDAADAAR